MNLCATSATSRYVGVDVSEAYIERAQRLYGDRAEFRVGDATRLDDDLRGFDLVLAFGVVHHLDDDGARAFWKGAAGHSPSAVRSVEVDPTFPGSTAARPVRHLRDRGNSVRSAEEYARLAKGACGEVRRGPLDLSASRTRTA